MAAVHSPEKKSWIRYSSKGTREELCFIVQIKVPQSAGKGLCVSALAVGVSAIAHLVAFTPVNIGAACESCCVEHVCGVDLHTASPVVRGKARSTMPCDDVITRQHQMLARGWTVPCKRLPFKGPVYT